MAYNNQTRTLKAQNTKQKIYESAEKLFIEKGVDNVSVDEIVKDAMVAKGSFYVHYQSKNALIASMLFDKINSVDNDYNNFLSNLESNITAEETLLLFLEMIADKLVNDIGHERMSVVYRTQITNIINDNAMMDYNRSLYKMIENIISKGIHNKEFKSSLSSTVIAKHFLIAYRGLTYEWCVRYPDFDLKKQVNEHFTFMIKGLK